MNIYTDSKYAYLTLQAHAAIWKERQFKTATGEPIKHFREIERLLTAIYCPKEVAVMHCKGHSRDGSKAAAGNLWADSQAKKAALYETPSLQTPLIWTGPVEQEKPQYTEEELERYEKRGAKITDKGWLQSEDGRLIIPENAQWKILKGLHQSFHLGVESTYQIGFRYSDSCTRRNLCHHSYSVLHIYTWYEH